MDDRGAFFFGMIEGGELLSFSRGGDARPHNRRVLRVSRVVSIKPDRESCLRNLWCKLSKHVLTMRAPRIPG